MKTYLTYYFFTWHKVGHVSWEIIRNRCDTYKTVFNSLFFLYRYIQVDGQKYYGKGRSKKLARAEAAAVALRDFVQFKDSTATLALTANELKHVDFTSDEQLEQGTKPLLNTFNSLDNTPPSTNPITTTIAISTDITTTNTTTNKTQNNTTFNSNNFNNSVISTSDHDTSESGVSSPSFQLLMSESPITITASSPQITQLAVSKEKMLLESVQRTLALHSSNSSEPIGSSLPKEYWVQRLESKYNYFFYFMFIYLVLDIYQNYYHYDYCIIINF